MLSVPATYDEPKGFSLLEAMASGVPVVQPRRGAFTEIVERPGGGLLVEPDEPEAWLKGCIALWRGPALRRKRLGPDRVMPASARSTLDPTFSAIATARRVRKSDQREAFARARTASLRNAVERPRTAR